VAIGYSCLILMTVIHKPGGRKGTAERHRPLSWQRRFSVPDRPPESNKNQKRRK
jgi:hypothetical protein